MVKGRRVKFKYVESDQMIPILEATEAASVSGARVMKAFFFPSGLWRVLTALAFTLYKSLKALLIWILFALGSTRKVKVFLSVIALLAFYVLRG